MEYRIYVNEILEKTFFDYEEAFECDENYPLGVKVEIRKYLKE